MKTCEGIFQISDHSPYVYEDTETETLTYTRKHICFSYYCAVNYPKM